jgi:hypothetical protein
VTRRDYTSYFVIDNELSTGQQLDFFLTDAVPFADRAERLAMLHSVLELVLVVKNRCDIPHASVRQLFQDGVQYHRRRTTATTNTTAGSPDTSPPTFEVCLLHSSRAPTCTESASVFFSLLADRIVL